MAESRGRKIDRRTVIGGALTVTGVLAVSGAVQGAGFPRSPLHDEALDVSRPGDALRRWITLTVDGDGSGDVTGGAVPITLSTSGDGHLDATVMSMTGRSAVAADEDGTPAESATVPVTPGYDARVWVTPLGVGDPLEPADTLVVNTSHGEANIDVYIEPLGGKWLSAGPGGSELDLDICAVHAVHMNTGSGTEILMWSPPRRVGEDGEPERKPGSPEEWVWDLNHVGDTEIRTLDTRTLRSTDRNMVNEHSPLNRMRNIFCGASGHLPDGRVLIAGGHVAHDGDPDRPEHTPSHDIADAKEVFVYDPTTGAKAWERQPAHNKMKHARWYPTVTTLPDARVLISCGSTQVPVDQWPDAHDWNAQGYFSNINNDYEIWELDEGEVLRRVDLSEEVSLVDTGQVTKKGQQLATYPHVFVLPKGDSESWVAIVESNRGWLTTYDPASGERPLARASSLYRMRTEGSRSYPTYGACVLLPFASDATTMHILSVGGQAADNSDHQDLSENQPATDTAEILTVDTTKELAGQKRWKWTENSMSRPRVLCEATLLADGRVLVSGGAEKGWGNKNWEFVRESELFDPESGTFAHAATAAKDRRYHSTAVLQTDGTVLKMGSTGGFNDELDENGDYKYLAVHLDAERYWPGYLFRGPRPRILMSDTALHYGDSFSVTVSAGGHEDARVAIIKLSSTTHGNDMDQRFVWLESAHSGRSGGADPSVELVATAPVNPAAAPPGHYMLVVVSSEGIPSEARVVSVGD